MRFAFILTLLLSLTAPEVLLAETSANSFIVFSYHDVTDRREDALTQKALSVSTAELISQFSWLREHGYHAVSVDEIIAASEGGKGLPDKAVLLTFDDGYQSMYKRVFPLLKLFNYPAVFALVGKWMETPPGEKVLYGESMIDRERFLSWDQVREMQASGLAEFASHSYDLHHEIVANPQGNLIPAATSRQYNRVGKSYESDTQYRNRLESDLKKSIQIMKNKTGRRPRVMVWPYGRYNRVALAVAKNLGMKVTMGTKEGKNNVDDLEALKRFLLPDDITLEDFVWELYNYDYKDPVRVAHIDLDYVYDPNPAVQERNLGLLLDRIKELQINTVYLQAFADPDGDGNADKLYFPNRHLPMRADLFSRAAWQLSTRSGVEVYAWLPVFSFELKEEKGLSSIYVKTAPESTKDKAEVDYRRLSPFSDKAKEIVGEIYEDLAKHAAFHGILFHDDAYLSDYEDASELALDYYAREWLLPPSIQEIRNDPRLFKDWTEEKTNIIIEWTQHLMKKVRYYHPEAKSARNIYSKVVLNRASETWFAQSFEKFLENYDYTALMAMPYMEGAGSPEKWLKTLVERVAEVPGGLDKTVFELQSIDWKRKQSIDSAILARQMKLLRGMGVHHFGYYPDDFILASPDIDTIKQEISLSDYPYKVK